MIGLDQNEKFNLSTFSHKNRRKENKKNQDKKVSATGNTFLSLLISAQQHKRT
jgi:hypothetical protein